MSSQIDKDREEARDLAESILDGLADSEYVICGENVNMLVDEISRIRSEAFEAGRAEERQMAAERICAIHCGSNENQTPTRWDGKCLYFDTCTYVSAILADDKNHIPTIGEMADDKENI